MKIKRLVIENFKSIERIELSEPNPFTVFVGPNGSGKSNIFEALEFVNLNYKLGSQGALSVMGGWDSIRNRHRSHELFKSIIEFADYEISIDPAKSEKTDVLSYIYSMPLVEGIHMHPNDSLNKKQFINGFTRLFVKNNQIVKISLNDNQRLSLSAANLEKVLKRILSDQTLRAEIFEWLDLFVPGFRAVEVDDRDELHWFEESIPDYFTKDLISDGTYNILAMLAAVYQSDDKPQFLCIEEPENGLHPQVAGELVDFFRIMCEERGHYIWLNTHSQSMAARVKPEEFVIVEKKQGATVTRQFRKEDFHGMRVDEAWLTNALNGGLAW
ncbi:AAA family ATPase [Spirosoma sp. SC4-14]|uniref:AAA family ATPase n=1 Tax=Spirosoma sp. SC4-14 TaxID=3128900 RepID=UPI0030D36386